MTPRSFLGSGQRFRAIRRAGLASRRKILLSYILHAISDKLLNLATYFCRTHHRLNFRSAYVPFALRSLVKTGLRGHHMVLDIGN